MLFSDAKHSGSKVTSDPSIISIQVCCPRLQEVLRLIHQKNILSVSALTRKQNEPRCRCRPRKSSSRPRDSWASRSPAAHCLFGASTDSTEAKNRGIIGTNDVPQTPRAT